MRKFVGLVAAAALLVPAVVFMSQPAGAAGGTVCKAGSGSATFTPPLPPITSSAKVKDTLKSVGTVSKCSGPVSSAKLTGVSPKSTGSNCTTIANTKAAPTKITLTVKWNKGAASTIAGQLAVTKAAKPKPTNQTFTGKVTKGQFAGLHVTGNIQYTIGGGQCISKPLSKVTYKDLGSFTLK